MKLLLLHKEVQTLFLCLVKIEMEIINAFKKLLFTNNARKSDA